MASYQVTLSDIKKQTDKGDVVFVTWTFDEKANYKANSTVSSKPIDQAPITLKEYEVEWTYTLDIKKSDGNLQRFEGSTTTIKQGALKTSTFNVPEGATKIICRVRPVANDYTTTTNNKSTTNPYYKGDWCAYKYYTVAMQPDPPENITLEKVDLQNGKYKLIATATDQPIEYDTITFKIINFTDNRKITGGETTIKLVKGYARYELETNVTGKVYALQAKVTSEKGIESEWTGYKSENQVSTGPEKPTKIELMDYIDADKISIAWNPVSNATGGYTISYGSNKNEFDDKGNPIPGASSIQTIDAPNQYNVQAIISGLSGSPGWYFYIRTNDSDGAHSPWVGPTHIIIKGQIASPPTTFSSVTVLSDKDSIMLYWIHNSNDSFWEKEAEIAIWNERNGNVVKTITVKNNRPDSEKYDTSKYGLEKGDLEKLFGKNNTTGTFMWQVRTKGKNTTEFSDFSVVRSFSVYAEPSVQLDALWANGTHADYFNISNAEFPLTVYAAASPDEQTPINYRISIVSGGSYVTTNALGEYVRIMENQEIFSDTVESETHLLQYQISPLQVTLNNNSVYILRCDVVFDSGLQASCDIRFTVNFGHMNYMMGITPKDVDFLREYSLGLYPSCTDQNGNILDRIRLSVYRKSFDDKFVPIARDLHNTGNSLVIDRFPPLNNAVYRLVATHLGTGEVVYTDSNPINLGVTSIVINWGEGLEDNPNESAQNVNVPYNEDTVSSHILVLPYNIDISENTGMDVAMVNYIGRSSPVSYYGTQIGHIGTWSCDIPKSDIETITKLRRLQSYLGDVYVREPSGVGYWANVKVSFNRNHCEVVVPVSIQVTRVEGEE